MGNPEELGEGSELYNQIENLASHFDRKQKAHLIPGQAVIDFQIPPDA